MTGRHAFAALLALLPAQARTDTTCTATAVGALAFGTVAASGDTDVPPPSTWPAPPPR